MRLGPICRLLLAGSARSGFTGLLEYDAVAIPQPPPRLLSPPSFSPLSLEHAVQPSGLSSWGPSYPSSLISGPTYTLNCIISLGLSLCRLLSFEATRSHPPPLTNSSSTNFNLAQGLVSSKEPSLTTSRLCVPLLWASLSHATSEMKTVHFPRRPPRLTHPAQAPPLGIFTSEPLAQRLTQSNCSAKQGASLGS